jgi:transposase
MRAQTKGRVEQARIEKNRRPPWSQPSREQLRRQNERLLEENEDLRRRVAEREKQIAERDQEIAQREKQIADLERQLAGWKKNSTNSSKPPSSDGLAGPQRTRGCQHKSKRKAGGQPGHPGHHRKLVATAAVSRIEVLLPHHCRHCGGSLPQQTDRVMTQGEPRRHQVTEIPTVQAHITEYQFPHVVCGHCHHVTCAPLPGAIAGQFGPQLTALIAYWTVVCRLPRRLVEMMLA